MDMKHPQWDDYVSFCLLDVQAGRRKSSKLMNSSAFILCFSCLTEYQSQYSPIYSPAAADPTNNTQIGHPLGAICTSESWLMMLHQHVKTTQAMNQTHGPSD